MPQRRRYLLLAPIALLLAFSVGCSFSASSKSSSTSSRSSSASARSSFNSSSSSSPGHEERAYQEDVRDYTAAYIQSGGNIDAFRKKLAQLAEEDGLSNWEANPVTYEAIGQGLADAGARQIQVDAFKENLCGGDPTKQKAMQDGFDSTS